MVFMVGDVVRLKSGGPELTIHSLRGLSDHVEVAWFDGGKINFVIVHRFALTLVKSEKGGG